MTLEISGETKVRVLANARARGLDVDDYLRRLMLDAEEQSDFVSPSRKALRTWRPGGYAQCAKRSANSGQSLAFQVEITEAALADAEEFGRTVRGEDATAGGGTGTAVCGGEAVGNSHSRAPKRVAMAEAGGTRRFRLS